MTSDLTHIWTLGHMVKKRGADDDADDAERDVGREVEDVVRDAIRPVEHATARWGRRFNTRVKIS